MLLGPPPLSSIDILSVYVISQVKGLWLLSLLFLLISTRYLNPSVCLPFLTVCFRFFFRLHLLIHPKSLLTFTRQRDPVYHPPHYPIQRWSAVKQFFENTARDSLLKKGRGAMRKRKWDYFLLKWYVNRSERHEKRGITWQMNRLICLLYLSDYFWLPFRCQKVTTK